MIPVVRTNPLSGRRFKVGDEFRLHVDADGNERVVPDTPEWKDKSVQVRVLGVWSDGIDEMATGIRIYVVDEGSNGTRPVCVRPRGRDWALAEGGLEYTPLWSRRRSWELLPA
jgi:hypothetical protein